MSRLLRLNADKFEVDQPTSSWSGRSRFLESRGTEMQVRYPRCVVEKSVLIPMTFHLYPLMMIYCRLSRSL